MNKERLLAFSDGVIAILITIMVLEFKAPHEASFAALTPLLPTFLSYVLSFVYLGIYWNNHHHLFQAAERVDGGVLWANLHLLFWLSLVPFVTEWMGEIPFAAAPVALYGVVLLASGFAYYILAQRLVALHGQDSALARAIGRDAKGLTSLLIYATSIGLAFAHPRFSCLLYAVVAVLWLIPDGRIEKTLTKAA